MRGTKACRVTAAAAAGQTLAAAAAPRQAAALAAAVTAPVDLSQEEILDLVVEAMLAAGGPGAEDGDLGDDDGGVDADGLAGSLRDTRDWDTGDTGDTGDTAGRAPAGPAAAPRDSAPGSPLMCCGRDPYWPGKRTVCIPVRCGGSATTS